ncbi:sensor histidine kinase [Sphingomonas cavernae]|uniref:histidine kinase n=1 Tax=Sphingomonas cavernae TaxID=2320861 RepID=A0A418WMZ1_9SPHN|nr:HAMP domain-containing sensor histidine kinase [Sphingomonas cavernae]RJF91363.1 sensor histidine kinase [Sphingomonas cavernae]
MRFDDMAATVIARVGASPEARAVAWHQLVDLAAQRRGDSEDPDALYAVLRKWRSVVPVERRRLAAESLVGRPIPAALFAYFASDVLSVCAPLARSVQLSPTEWRALLPRLPIPVRALLRHRDDLDPETARALESFGPADRVIPAPVPAIETKATPSSAPSPASEGGDAAMGGGVQIRELVNRIEAYRRHRPVHRPLEPRAPSSSAEARAEHFRFETGADGVLIWIDGAARGPLVGLSIATPAERADHGVDGYAAGAFRRRAPFRDARLTIPGAGEVSGEWRISAVPFFNAHDGRFTGYRGTARRPRVDEVASSAAAQGLYGSALRPESLRQLVHELRTPLNAIMGFAEMIDGQMLGPAAQDYRARALDIVSEARKLLGAVDDLDTAARVDSNALRLRSSHVDSASMLSRICADLAPLSGERRVALDIAVAGDLPEMTVDPIALERMFSRLLSAIIAVSAGGEALSVRLVGEARDQVALNVARPKALIDQDERALLDPGYSPDGDWPDAPLLGLGFALRLVRNLAEAAGGRFVIRRDAFVLVLPGAVGSAGAGEGSG